jgi:ADP-ribose pyrophosphatase YjhB (NUDIX family)
VSADIRETRVAGYALCLEDDRILLCRIAPGSWSGVGSWTLPGGGIDFGEAPAEAAIRELEEETGLIGEIEALAGVFSWFTRLTRTTDGVEIDFHGIQVVYRVRLTGGELRDEPDGSSDQARWVSRDELDQMPLVDLAREGVRLAFGA